jgi:UDP:flavonoid glycosyltransferase YjiC (YdhE family)
LQIREWLHMLWPMLPSLVPIAVARTRLLRQYDASVVPRPAFPAPGGLNLALFPRDFQPPNPRLDARFRFVGPLIDPEPRPDAPFELSGSGPLVYMSLGTLHGAPTAFYRQCLGRIRGHANAVRPHHGQPGGCPGARNGAVECRCERVGSAAGGSRTCRRVRYPLRDE